MSRHPRKDREDAATLHHLLRQTIETVAASGEIIRHNWRKASEVRHKGRIDLVTDTDLAVEKFLQPRLEAIAPNACFMSEESAPEASGPLRWIVDPVDGTTNFVHRIPQVATSVALWRDDQPLLGVVSVPMLNEIYHAGAGLGAFLNDQPIHVSTVGELADCLLATGFPYELPDRMPLIMARLGAVLPRVQGLRRIGAAAIDLAYVACGRLDAYYEDWLKPWDMAAGALLVREAGGCVSGLDGDQLAFDEPLLASNGLLHEKLARLLGPAGREGSGG